MADKSWEGAGRSACGLVWRRRPAPHGPLRRTPAHLLLHGCRFMAFDRHMNLVLGDAEEFRQLPPKKGVPEDEVRREPPLAGRLTPQPLLICLASVCIHSTAAWRSWHLVDHAMEDLSLHTTPSKPNPNPPPPDDHVPNRLAACLQREQRRLLGLVVLRGDEVIDLMIEGPPPADESRLAKQQVAPAGPGVGRAAGRGMPVAAPGQAPPGLAGPAAGFGGPAPGSMMPRPQMQAAPMMRCACC